MLLNFFRKHPERRSCEVGFRLLHSLGLFSGDSRGNGLLSTRSDEERIGIFKKLRGGSVSPDFRSESEFNAHS